MPPVANATSDLVIDTWSPLSHKLAVGDAHHPSTWLAPSWVPNDARRRLAAYKVLAAYRANVARLFLTSLAPIGADWDDLVEAELAKRSHREYGDAALVGDRIKSGILGEHYELCVAGADRDVPDQPPIGERPIGDDTSTPLGQRILTARQAAWDRLAAEAVDQWEADLAAHPSLRQRQQELRGWADTIGLSALVDEAEGDAVHLGDTVYVLWPRDGDWPTVEVYDPGFYFPDVTDRTRGYPDRVFLCWEFCAHDELGVERRFVRRLTFELVDIADTRLAPTGRGFVDPQGQPSDTPVLYGGENVDEFGVVWRVQPWQRDVAGAQIVDEQVDWRTDPTGATTIRTPQQTRRTCLFSDETWLFDDMDRKVDTLDPSNTQPGAVRRMDLGVDFIPVVHIPNTPASRETWGQSSVAIGAQLLDDISAMDTDVFEAMRLASVPMLVLKNAQLDAHQTLEVRPGTVLETGEGGGVDVVSAAAGLAAITAAADRLADRFLQNVRVPKSLVGRVSSERAASGIAMLIESGPFAQLIGTLRMPRESKYRLLAKMAQRLAQVQGALPPGPTPDAFMQFGSFLPLDRTQVATDVSLLLKAKVISTYTAVTWLVAAGYQVDDARAEVDRVREEDWARAEAIKAATGSSELAADSMGLDLPPQQMVPTPKQQYMVNPDPAGPAQPAVVLPSPTPGGASS